MPAPTLNVTLTATLPADTDCRIYPIAKDAGIALPLEDLFLWSDPQGPRAQKLESAAVIGPATVDGVDTDHYAFREGSRDWEIWIQKGDRPLPRKLAIVDRTDPARPAYVAHLSWTEHASFTPGDFSFAPDANAKRIQLATLTP